MIKIARKTIRIRSRRKALIMRRRLSYAMLRGKTIWAKRINGRTGMRLFYKMGGSRFVKGLRQ